MAFDYCSKDRPCAICGDTTADCRRNGDGLHFCRHTAEFDSPPGFVSRGMDRIGNSMWSEEGREDRPRSGRPRSSPATFAAPPKQKREESPFVRFSAHSEPLCGIARAFLASSLGLPESAVDAFRECRYDGTANLTQPVFTLPEWGYDDAGAWRVVGLHVRFQDEKKRTYGDPDQPVKRGLTWFPDWDRGGTVYVVEGASDTLALRCMGLTVIGRPSNSGGGAFLARLLFDHPGREVVIVAENDRKANGSWPGREGAEKVAAEVAGLWGHPVRVAALPEGVKDARAWFCAHYAGATSDPLRLGPAFAAACRAEVKVIRPAPAPRPAAAPPPADVGRSSDFLASMAALFASLPSSPEDRGPLYEAALAEQQEADRRDQRCHHCNHQRPLCQRHKATHAPRTIWVRCEKWACSGCRSYLIAREARNAAFRLGSADSLYEFGCTVEQYEAVAKRMRRAGAEYLAVRDGAGWWVCCSRRIDGSIPTTPEVALACFQARLDEWHGPKRPVKTSHGWRLPRSSDEDSSHENVMALPLGTTHEEVAEVAARFGAYSRRQMRAAASRVQQVAEWVRDEPWSEEDSRNFFIALACDLGGVSESGPTPEEEAYADRPFEAVPW